MIERGKSMARAAIAASKLSAPVPRAAWPLLARIVAKFAKPGEKGIGDTIAAQLGSPGEWFKSAMKTLAGGCGCDRRSAWLNSRYPYSPPASATPDP